MKRIMIIGCCCLWMAVSIAQRMPSAAEASRAGREAMGIGFLGIISTVDMSDSGNDFRKGYEGLGWGSAVVFFGGSGAFFVSVPYVFIGPAKQKRAIKLFKKDMQKNALSSDVKLSFGITPTGNVGLALNF